MEITLQNGRKYHTNIKDSELLQRCNTFFSTGCQSKVISMTKNSEIIKTVENYQNVAIVSEFNKDAYFCNELAKQIIDLNIELTAKELGIKLIEKGFDLIKLI
jgi:hypothetical protein